MRRGYFALALAVAGADQLSKAWAERTLAGRDAVEVVPGLFDLWYSRNPGGLFGMFSGMPDPWRTLLLTAVPLFAVALIALYLARSDEPQRRTLAGLALILGGAAGNLIDRIARGSVIDFLDFYVSHEGLARWLTGVFGTAHWPTFNVADCGIVVGAGCLLVDILRPARARAG